MYKVGMISLGCPKNQVDAERMLAKLDAAEFEVCDCYDGVDAVIVNTCGFIDAAKEEAIENILDMAQLKSEGTVGKIIVTGCLAQRYKDEIFSEMPEVDAVIGIGANDDIAEIVKSVIDGEREYRMPENCCLPLTGERLLTTPEYWSYLKIADGCSNRCTYCAIPSIRGDYRSVEFETLIEEAKQLAAAGTKELILIAQDTTNYGKDLYGKIRLPELLDALCEIDGIEWIRMLYCYPDKITDELLETMARQPKVIRTTFIVGFPGEGEKEFEDLAEFVNEIEFDRLGCFAFSPQEGTPAFDMPDQVEEDVKTRRGEIIMQDQLEIVTLKNKSRVGKAYRVLVEDYDGYADCYKGRTYMDAPEIDGTVSFTTDKDYENGDFAEVEIIGVNDYDLIGRDISE